MPKRRYTLLEKFLDTYQSQGFENINPEDSLLQDLETHAHQHKQFFYVADLMLMKIRYVSKNSVDFLGIDPGAFDLSSILSRVHPDDFHKHNLARSMVIKKGYELLMNKSGISVQSICTRIRHETGFFIDAFVQVYNLYSAKQKTVFTLALFTDLSGKGIQKYKYHYYIGNDPAMFRSPDDALLKIGHNFSGREFEIITLIAEGLDSEHIASQLALSLNTINTHRRNILKKTKKATLRDLIDELREKGML